MSAQFHVSDHDQAPASGIGDAVPTILVNHLLEPSGRLTGITRYLFALLQALAERGRHRYVLATTWSAEDLPDALTRAGVVCLTRRDIGSMPLNVLAQLRMVRRLMRETGASLEFNANPIGGFFGDWPRVVTVHDLYYNVSPQDYPMRRRIAWNLIFPRVLASADAIICVSNATRHQVVRHYPAAAPRTHVVLEASALNWSIHDGSQPLDIVEQSFGLIVGNLSPNKNPAVLVAALKSLEEQGRYVPFFHVGRDELGLLSDAQKKSGLVHPIVSVGSPDDARLAQFYRQARCLVVTSLDEGFCLPVIEAQSVGTPVICSDIPVLREVAGDAGLFFDARQSDELAARIIQIFSDDVLHADMSHRSRANATRFSWKKAARETESLFEELLSKRHMSRRS